MGPRGGKSRQWGGGLARKRAQTCSGTGALPCSPRCSQRPRNTLPTAVGSLPEGQGEVAGGTLHTGITGLSKLEKHRMTLVQVRAELSS